MLLCDLKWQYVHRKYQDLIKNLLWNTNLISYSKKLILINYKSKNIIKFRDISKYDQIRYNNHGIGNVFWNFCDMHDIIVTISIRNQPYISILFQIWCLLFRRIDKFDHLNTTNAVSSVRCEKFTVSRNKSFIVYVFFCAKLSISN